MLVLLIHEHSICFLLFVSSLISFFSVVNILAPKIGATKYTRIILEDFKKDIDSHTRILGDFNSPLSTMDVSSKQNMHKDM